MPLRQVIRHEAIVVGISAVGLTTTAADNVFPQVAEVVVEDEAIRYRVDGNDPSATVGTGVEPGGVITLFNRGEITMFRAIRRDGADATLRVNQGVDYVP